ncbi:hypothetical protein PACTADRAFT_79724 [Pachysolen tannophilus NRRL Y-2460]|uniref:Seipin n=1 Tax=Pachysolen tannophilus NRRL Y-2460 TaxID=669874 RepID=A0A1E4U087_PACTA|nr:hypothetical protein PACTADRAFT_79724 [Pachysolen tannophilus NRRL Y-2460]
MVSVHVGLPLALTRSTLYIVATFFSIVLVLFPISVITYLKFYSSLIPSPSPFSLLSGIPSSQYSAQYQGGYRNYNLNFKIDDVRKRQYLVLDMADLLQLVALDNGISYDLDLLIVSFCNMNSNMFGLVSERTSKNHLLVGSTISIIDEQLYNSRNLENKKKRKTSNTKRRLMLFENDDDDDIVDLTYTFETSESDVTSSLFYSTDHDLIRKNFEKDQIYLVKESNFIIHCNENSNGYYNGIDSLNNMRFSNKFESSSTSADGRSLLGGGSEDDTLLAKLVPRIFHFFIPPFLLHRSSALFSWYSWSSPMGLSNINYSKGGLNVVTLNLLKNFEFQNSHSQFLKKAKLIVEFNSDKILIDSQLSALRMVPNYKGLRYYLYNHYYVCLIIGITLSWFVSSFVCLIIASLVLVKFGNYNDLENSSPGKLLNDADNDNNDSDDAGDKAGGRGHSTNNKHDSNVGIVKYDNGQSQKNNKRASANHHIYSIYGNRDIGINSIKSQKQSGIDTSSSSSSPSAVTSPRRHRVQLDISRRNIGTNTSIGNKNTNDRNKYADNRRGIESNLHHTRGNRNEAIPTESSFFESNNSDYSSATASQVDGEDDDSNGYDSADTGTSNNSVLENLSILIGEE